MIDVSASEGWLLRLSCHHGEMSNFFPEWWEISLHRFCTGIYVMGQKGCIKTWHWILAKIYLIHTYHGLFFVNSLPLLGLLT